MPRTPALALAAALLAIPAAALVAIPAARAADAPAAAAAAAAEPAAAAPAPVKPASKGGDRAHVEEAVAVLSAYAHTTRKGDAGTAAWAELATHAADKIALKVGGTGYDVDVAGKKAEAKLIKFSKISNWVEEKVTKGVKVEVLEFKIGKDSHSGKGTIAMSQKDGTWKVDSIEAE
jgi:hypothetical protein